MEKRGYTGREKRRFIRAGLPFFVHYQKRGKIADENEPLAGLVVDIMSLSLTKNISEGGIRFVTRERFESGTYLAVDIHVPDRKSPIRTLTKVVWTKKRPLRSGYDTGVRFIKVDEGDRKDLSYYLSTLQKVEELGTG